MERDYESESRADLVVSIVAVIISLLVTGLNTLWIAFIWLGESYGFWGDLHNEGSPRALTLLGVLILHLILMAFMLFARRMAFKWMIGLSIVDIVLMNWIFMDPTGFFCPLVNIIFLAITLGQLNKDPTKETGGFEVIVKEKK